MGRPSYETLRQLRELTVDVGVFFALIALNAIFVVLDWLNSVYVCLDCSPLVTRSTLEKSPLLAVTGSFR